MERAIRTAGNVRIPVGFRFNPTDNDLVHFYLRKKVFSQPHQCDTIPEFDVFQAEPWILPSDERNFKDWKYFYYNTKGREFENVHKRAAGSGFWITDGKTKAISSSTNNNLTGVRNTLVFWKGKGSNLESKTEWLMHEFRIFRKGTQPDPSEFVVADMALYRIFKKSSLSRGSNREAPNIVDLELLDELEDEEPNVIDVKVEGGGDSVPPPPSPSP